MRATALTSQDQQQLEGALRQFDSGDLQTALPVLRRLADRYPNSADAHTATGMALAELGQVAGSIPYLERAHHLRPQDAAIGVNLGVAYLKLQKPADAMRILRQTAHVAPANAEVQLLLSQVELQTGDATAAAAGYAQTAKLLKAAGTPTDADFLHDWALALIQSKQAPAALGLLENAPETENNAALQSLLADSNEATGHYEAAVTHFKRAATLDGSEDNTFRYAQELVQHWTFPAAIEIFRFGGERYPQSDRMKLGLAIALYGNNQFADAVAVLDTILRQTPDSAVAADLLGRSCNALSGAVAPGCDSLQTFAREHPSNAPASLYAAISILHQPLDQRDNALVERLLRNAVQQDPKLAEGWYQLGVLQQSQNNWPASADSLAKAIAVRPAYPEAHYRLARAYSHMNRREDAQQEVALQQKYTTDAKAEENKRMQEVMTFLTTPNQ